jgi:outer membrane protein insertion porin family/translocation and assembly module TamA
VVRDQQLLLFRAFYSGGPSSNRGYPYRGVGPHGVLGFLAPSSIDCTLPENVERDECVRPLGGLTLWEASAEVRFPIVEPFGGAVFLDASDVTRDVGEIRFDFPHLSTGVGLRYDTPVGPLRADVGYRIAFAQEVGEAELRTNEGDPDEVFGAPIAIHIALGEAF